MTTRERPQRPPRTTAVLVVDDQQLRVRLVTVDTTLRGELLVDHVGTQLQVGVDVKLYGTTFVVDAWVVDRVTSIVTVDNLGNTIQLVNPQATDAVLVDVAQRLWASFTGL